jgi:hypothetical protein
MYEVLLDIHQTLYLGRTYAQCGRPSGGAGMGVVKRRRRMSRYGSWGRRVKEIKRVIEKSFEGDCGTWHSLIHLRESKIETLQEPRAKATGQPC